MTSKASARSEQSNPSSANRSDVASSATAFDGARSNPTLHPLLSDDWMSPGSDDFATVPAAHVANLTRAGSAIRLLARLLHNSLGEPDMNGAQPLNKGAERELCDAVWCLGDYVFEKTDAMREFSASFSVTGAEVSHG
jgi:hypothetical protein